MDGEEVKLIKEVSKTTRKGMEITEKLSVFLNKIAGEGFSNIGAIFSDWTAYYRYKNLLLLQDRVKKIHENRKIEGETIPIPPRYLIPIIRCASEEDDETLQQMWAGLLANAIDPNKEVNINKMYIEILSSFEPFNSIVLKVLSELPLPLFEQEQKGFTIDEIVNKAKLTPFDIPKEPEEMLELVKVKDKIKGSLMNLIRLGCVASSRTVPLEERLPFSFNGSNTTLHFKNDEEFFPQE